MGRRPVELTEAEKAEVETLAAVLSTEQIADYFGIGRRTFWDLMARDEDIAARYKRGKARAIGAIAQSLITKARSGDTASMIFFLKTQAGWRETERIEHATTVRSPKDIEADDAAARLVARLDELARRMQSAGNAASERMPAPVVEGRALTGGGRG